MHKTKRWQSVLIATVIFLTVYNILPTVFYYAKPLSAPVDRERAEKIADRIGARIDSLLPASIEWIRSFCDLLKISPKNIVSSDKTPEKIEITFADEKSADRFRQYLPKAGALIPFVPAQLSPAPAFEETDNGTVAIRRNIPVSFSKPEIDRAFSFAAKRDDKGMLTPEYRNLVEDRVNSLIFALSSPGKTARFSDALYFSKDEALNGELSSFLADALVSFTTTFGEKSEIAKRYFSCFFSPDRAPESKILQTVLQKFEETQQSLRRKIDETEKEFTGSSGEAKEAKQILSTKIDLLQKASKILERNTDFFLASSGSTNNLKTIRIQETPSSQIFSLEGKNPFITSVRFDPETDTVQLLSYSDLPSLQNISDSEGNGQKEGKERFLFAEAANISEMTGETVVPCKEGFRVNLSGPETKSFLLFRLETVARASCNRISEILSSSWQPRHPDLQPSALPVNSSSEYGSLPLHSNVSGFFIYAPAISEAPPVPGFRMNSVYVIAKGLGKLVNRIQASPPSPETKIFATDFDRLRNLLARAGYLIYEGSPVVFGKEFAGDLIFEAPDYFRNVLAASREQFEVKGSKRYAVLEFRDVEQRILAENAIDDAIHETLLKQRDDYRAAQLGLKGTSRFDVPKPTQNALLANLRLSAVKYFRGDNRKILQWGLDLSGGKTVQMELRDASGKLVTDDADMRQAINELYARVNKMGVSEVGIRREGNLITLDFPGSQHLSAGDLIKASSMFFHVVNEKFSSGNALLAEYVNRFLQDVWNEASVTGKKDPEEINKIAARHLYGEALNPDVIRPAGEAGSVLYKHGLRLANPDSFKASNLFDETFSKVAVLAGDDYTDWNGQTHPLVFVFANYALQGSDLTNVQASYDPSKGNFLSFEVRGNYTSKEGLSLYPRDAFAAWTGPFSKEKIAGSSNGAFSRNGGWRMAVILNGSIVSSPTLDSPLRDRAMITGGFSQREINRLEADLKAGSLTFSPKILSEQNISPELGTEERAAGIRATGFALLLVIAVMIGYYRFGGLIASVAVLFNLLILWAILQNLQARLTLANLAGLILTMGMAVDANVLVFERIREEFAATGKLASAIRAGYKKAFSAILDSNVTTVIAALILLQFHSGPIKGFAVTLIAGIVSSMFTALFMTKYFFFRWMAKPDRPPLHMMNWFKAKNFDFLKYGKAAGILSILVILLGTAGFLSQKQSLFGMDFTGGYSLVIDLEPTENGSYSETVRKAFLKAGVAPSDMQIRELSPPNRIKIFFHKNFEQTQNTFSGTDFPVNAVFSILEKNGIPTKDGAQEAALESRSEVSGQMSQTMRNGALLGLSVALLCIFVYIVLRFEFKYAAGATLCLIHDILLTLASIALLHVIKVPVQIDLTTIAALLTIAGYSLNDTIIVFDRIREEATAKKSSRFPDLINRALNITLSRTVLTSGTTLLVLIPLVCIGKGTIFEFGLIMGIGVIFGTLSSLFIAAPLMLFFHRKEMSKQQNVTVNDR